MCVVIQRLLPGRRLRPPVDPPAIGASPETTPGGGNRIIANRGTSALPKPHRPRDVPALGTSRLRRGEGDIRSPFEPIGQPCADWKRTRGRVPAPLDPMTKASAAHGPARLFRHSEHPTRACVANGPARWFLPSMRSQGAIVHLPAQRRKPSTPQAAAHAGYAAAPSVQSPTGFIFPISDTDMSIRCICWRSGAQSG